MRLEPAVGAGVCLTLAGLLAVSLGVAGRDADRARTARAPGPRADARWTVAPGSAIAPPATPTERRAAAARAVGPPPAGPETARAAHVRVVRAPADEARGLIEELARLARGRTSLAEQRAFGAELAARLDALDPAALDELLAGALDAWATRQGELGWSEMALLRGLIARLGAASADAVLARLDVGSPGLSISILHLLENGAPKGWEGDQERLRGLAAGFCREAVRRLAGADELRAGDGAQKLFLRAYRTLPAAERVEESRYLLPLITRAGASHVDRVLCADLARAGARGVLADEIARRAALRPGPERTALLLGAAGELGDGHLDEPAYDLLPRIEALAGGDGSADLLDTAIGEVAERWLPVDHGGDYGAWRAWYEQNHARLRWSADEGAYVLD